MLSDPSQFPKFYVRTYSYKFSPNLFDYLMPNQSDQIVQEFDIIPNSYLIKNLETNVLRLLTKEQRRKKNSFNTEQDVILACFKMDKVQQNPQSPQKLCVTFPGRLFQGEIFPRQRYNNYPYIILRNLVGNNQKNWYKLKLGDMIKFGSIQMKITEMQDRNFQGEQKGNKERKLQESIKHSFLNSVYQAGDNVKGTCKYCLEEQSAQNDFLFAPCKCRGSMSVHKDCLKQFIPKRIKRYNNGKVFSYCLNQPECQECKYPLPRLIINKDKQQQMLPIVRPNCPYLILQSLCQKNEGDYKFSIKRLQFQQNSVCGIGKSQYSHLILYDDSISNQHAIITFIDGNFYLQDLNTRFGTFLRNQALKIQVVDKMLLQVENTVLFFGIKESNLAI